jgi:hypothetical protein
VGLAGEEMTAPIADLNLIAWRDRAFTSCFDSDSETNPKVQEALNALAVEAYRRSARSVFNILLPAGENGEKNGLDDFIHTNGVEAFLDLDVQEIPSPYPRVKIWSGVELFNTQIERPPAIVKALGIRRSGKVMLTGAGGKGKSTLLLQAFCCDLAAGHPLFGYPQLSVTSPQRVLVFMVEDPISEVKFRWEQQMAALGYGHDVAERIAFIDPKGARLTLTNEFSRQVIFDAIRRHRATAAVLNPLVAVHDVDENSNSAMRAVLDTLNPIIEETDCTFIIAHHEPKAPENNSASSRGASAIRDWCRTMLRLTAQKTGPDGSQRFQLDLDKANYGGSVWQLTLERKQDSYLFMPVDIEAAVTPRDVWELLGTDGGWFDDVQEQIMERFGVSKATAYRVLKKAEDRKIVEVGERINPDTNRKKSYLTRSTGPEGKE